MSGNNTYVDSMRHQGMRRKMLEEIQAKGIDDQAVLDAMYRVPRHWFLDKAFLERAYSNIAFPIGCEQTISHPYTVAYQTSLLGIEKGEKVLEIGTGCGYQTCVLYEMGAKVFSIERHRPLHIKAKNLFKEQNYRIKAFYGDGYKGLPTFAPFDKIIVTAGAPYIPDALIDQLKIGGMLVIPVGDSNGQVMNAVLKVSETDIQIEELDNFSFVPMLEEKAR